MKNPIKLSLLSYALCRSPAFSSQDELGEKWNELKKMIRLTSPSFYKLIKDYDKNDLKALSSKMGFTVWKYFNRTKFRPTPFGKFAAISLVPVSTSPGLPIVLAKNLSVHHFIDWQAITELTIDRTTQAVNAQWFISNSTVYTVAQSIRYIRVKDGFFELASVSHFDELVVLLDTCRTKTSRMIIYEKMAIAFNMSAHQVTSLLAQMLSLQLLFTEDTVNITGQDYFQRTGIRGKSGFCSYMITERKWLSGALDAQAMRELPQALNFLSKYLPDIENKDLTNFRIAFLKKFENTVVPLMTALDSEIGIGYASLGEQQADFQIKEILKDLRGDDKDEQHILYSGLNRFLIAQLMKGGTIRLDEYKNEAELSALPLPNTLSILLRFWKNQPIIENAGGCTANALLGRFTIANEKLEHFGREIAEIEINANPEILFFDVAYQLEKKVDNVNRRKQLYAYELPLMSWSCSEEPLSVDDIYVTVRGSEIILWSKKYHKRMMPRVPSAYNYTRSDLSIFRFLCDLQHHQIKSDLNMKLSYIFPGLNHYPRVCYKNIIIAPASWKLPAELLHSMDSETEVTRRVKLIEWLQGLAINFPFTSGNHDQILTFDPADSTDMDAFVSYCLQSKDQSIYISEALISDYDLQIADEHKKHIAQFIVSYKHDHPIYNPFKVNIPENRSDAAQFFSPGGKWLYFEIYCHPARSNEILISRLNLLLAEIKQQLCKWFFVRYDEPKPHLRVRLQLKDISEGYDIMGKLRLLLEPYLISGLVSDIQVKTYFQETLRYGRERISVVENLFFKDSKYVLRLLAKNKSTDELYLLTLVLMNNVIKATFEDFTEQLKFVKTMADSYGTELKLCAANFKLLNQRFEALKRMLHTADIQVPSEIYRAYHKLLGKTSGITDKQNLLADIFHMHVNRLFISNQRTHEGFLYQFLGKLLVSQHSQPASVAEC